MSNNGDDYEEDFDQVEGDTSSDEQIGDEEWDSYDEQQDDENLADEDQEMSQDVPQKKKSGLFNIVLIAVAIIAVGGFIFMKMGKAPSNAPIAPVVASAAPTPAPEAEPVGMLGSSQEMAQLQEAMAKHSAAQKQPESAPVTPTPQAVTPTTVPVAQVAAPALAMTQAQPASTPKEILDAKTPPMPTAIETTGSATLEKPTVAVLDAPPVIAKVDDSATHMPKAQDIMLKSPAAPEVTPAPAPTPSGNADAAALNVRIDTLLTRIASLETEVNSLKNKNDPADQINSLKDSVNTLEKKIDSLPTGGATKTSSKKAAPSSPESMFKNSEGSKPAPQILGTTDDSQSVFLAPAKKTGVAKPVKVLTSWSLKGAQPGQAMVAKTGESDIHTVGVGDSLPGVGKITAIEYQDGRWTVIGTQGRINQ